MDTNKKSLALAKAEEIVRLREQLAVLEKEFEAFFPAEKQSAPKAARAGKSFAQNVLFAFESQPSVVLTAKALAQDLEVKRMKTLYATLSRFTQEGKIRPVSPGRYQYAGSSQGHAS